MFPTPGGVAFEQAPRERVRCLLLAVDAAEALRKRRIVVRRWSPWFRWHGRIGPLSTTTSGDVDAANQLAELV